METRNCKSCKMECLATNFSKGKYTCKECRNKNKRTNYNTTKLDEFIKERTPIRNEFLREMLDGGWPIEEFNKKFIPLEKLNEMKKQPEIYTIIRCDELLKEWKKKYDQEFEKKYMLDAMFCVDEREQITGDCWIYTI